jgi:MFS family permease
MTIWWREADPIARRALIAAWLGWTLDSLDVMLYALVLPAMMASLRISAATGGWIQSLSLVASAAGGIVLGRVADRFGRTRALIISVVLYAVFTAACGFATGAVSLAIFRIGLGVGLGGEWASGAALISETWCDEHRGKALAFMQSGWPFGYALAAGLSWFIQRVLGFDWRVVFMAGVLPAMLALWVRLRVTEPERWRSVQSAAATLSVRAALGGRMLGTTVTLAVMNGCVLFAYWGLNTFLPSFLAAAPAVGGAGLNRDLMSGLVAANQIGTWSGFVTFGYVSDLVGRRRACIAYLLLATTLLWVYTTVRQPVILLSLGPLASFFTTGYFSSFGEITGELYPTGIRATAQGLTYNAGRIVSAVAPWIIGAVAESSGYSVALAVAASGFAVAAAFWSMLPETGGQLRAPAEQLPLRQPV